jgi:glycosyltransferase involved in cell wall biosynthesis
MPSTPNADQAKRNPIDWPPPPSLRRFGDAIVSRADVPAASGRKPVVWFEVEDFLRYFDHFSNPTGLQRVPFEIFAEAEKLYGRTGRVRFCRVSVYTRQFKTVGFGDIVAAYRHPPGAGAPWTTVWGPTRFLSKFSETLPTLIRHPRFFLGLLKIAAGDVVDMALRRRRFDRDVRPGDVIVSLGASWGFPNYAKLIAAAKRRYGVKFAALVYDLIPIDYGDFVEQQHALRFRTWLEQTIANADVVLTVSNYSRQALLRLAGEAEWPLPRVEVLELGTALNGRPRADDRRTISFPEPYVLVVSTIEIRKNHRLLITVWQRLLERHGADAIPHLVFAGNIGWMVDDLLTDLAGSNYLDGKIAHMLGLSDAELGQAYRSCLFTIFPSLCEGWGLPIAESLVHGKFCLASNRGAIPEVGGDLVDYFDPTDADDALAKIERALFDADYLAARQARLEAEFHPQTWDKCARALIGLLAEDAAGQRRAPG